MKLDSTMLERNYTSLLKTCPEYADVLSLVPESSRYSFDPAGTEMLCRDNSDGKWIHGPDDPWEAARDEATRMVDDRDALYVVLRPGLGYSACAVIEAVGKRSPGSLVIVVEDRLDLLRAALGLMDWSPILRSGFVVFLVGKPEIVVERFLNRHPRIALLPLTLVSPADANDAACGRLMDQLSAISEKTRAAADEELAVADVRLGERRSRSEPFRVVMAGPEFGYLEGPIAEGFRACGCNVELHRGNPRVPRAVRAHEWFFQEAGFAPDLFLWMNKPELSRFASEALRILKVASVLWTVDSPRRIRIRASDLETVDLHLSFDPHQLVDYEPVEESRRAQLSLAAGIDALPGCGPGDAVWPVRRGPKIGFVGSLAEGRIREIRELMQREEPSNIEYLENLASLPNDPGPVFERQTGVRYAGTPCLYVDELRAARRRIDVLSALPRGSLRIFGRSEWADEKNPLVSCYSGRSIQYGPDLSSVYYHCLINVNVFHAQCIDSTNSRVYDVLAAGGFLLSEDRPVLHREFEVGRHLDTFSTPEEAAEKVDYYLAHPTEREAMAREGQRHVLAHHTFADRCRRLLALARPFVGRAEAGRA
jgi:hypothetical protein